MRIRHIYKAVILCLAIAGCSILDRNPDTDKDISVNVSEVGSNGIVWFESPRSIPSGSRIEFTASDIRIEGQFVPSLDHNGWLTTKLPQDLVTRSQTAPVKLKICISEGAAPAPTSRKQIDIKTPAYTLTQRTDVQAGFPSRICYTSGQVLDNLTWGDRLYKRNATDSGKASSETWTATKDPNAGLVLVSDGPVCTVVQQTVHFAAGKGITPPSKPTGVYQWIFFKTKEGPVYLETRFDQESSFLWDQLHFGEMHFDKTNMHEWYGSNNSSEAATHGAVSGEKTISVFKNWAALADGKNFIAFHGSSVRLYATKRTNESIFMQPLIWDGKSGAVYPLYEAPGCRLPVLPTLSRKAQTHFVMLCAPRHFAV